MRRRRRRNPSIPGGLLFVGGLVTGAALAGLTALVLFSGPRA